MDSPRLTGRSIQCIGKIPKTAASALIEGIMYCQIYREGKEDRIADRLRNPGFTNAKSDFFGCIENYVRGNGFTEDVSEVLNLAIKDGLITYDPPPFVGQIKLFKPPKDGSSDIPIHWFTQHNMYAYEPIMTWTITDFYQFIGGCLEPNNLTWNDIVWSIHCQHHIIECLCDKSQSDSKYLHKLSAWVYNHLEDHISEMIRDRYLIVVDK